MFPSFGHLSSTPARCGTFILLRILRNLRRSRSLLYDFVLNNGILIIHLFSLLLSVYDSSKYHTDRNISTLYYYRIQRSRDRAMGGWLFVQVYRRPLIPLHILFLFHNVIASYPFFPHKLLFHMMSHYNNMLIYFFEEV